MPSSDHAVPKVLTSADGAAIYAEAKGDQSKPAVVFIHGFSVSSQVVENVFNDSKWLEQAYLASLYSVSHHSLTNEFLVLITLALI